MEKNEKNFGGMEIAPNMVNLIHRVFNLWARKREEECLAVLRQLLEEQQHYSPLQQLMQAATDASPLFWASTSWAVVYAVARDMADYQGSVSDFERMIAPMAKPPVFNYPCPQGTIHRAFNHHPYMHKPIHRWEENGASRRELALLHYLCARMD